MRIIEPLRALSIDTFNRLDFPGRDLALEKLLLRFSILQVVRSALAPTWEMPESEWPDGTYVEIYRPTARDFCRTGWVSTVEV
jgi:hypothetical protein